MYLGDGRDELQQRCHVTRFSLLRWQFCLPFVRDGDVHKHIVPGARNLRFAIRIVSVSVLRRLGIYRTLICDRLSCLRNILVALMAFNFMLVSAVVR